MLLSLVGFQGDVAIFALAILGGLWMPVTVFPGFMQTIAWGLPSFHLGQLALGASGRAPFRKMGSEIRPTCQSCSIIRPPFS